MMPSSEPSLPDHSLLGAGALGPEFFYLSSDGQFVLLSIEPVAETVDVKMLQGLLQQSAFRNYQISDKALQEAAKSLNELKEPPAEGVESKSHSVVIVARRLDGQVSIALSKDGMSATATVTAPFAGKAVDEAQLRSALGAAGVVMGIEEEAMAGLLAQVAALPPGASQSALVARGQLPIHGADSRFERLVETLRERVRRPQLQDRQHDRVDFRDFGVIVTVVPGDALMCRHPPELGVAGFKVTGECLIAKAGSELAWNVGAGTQISEEDPNLLVAIQEGLPIEIERGIQVDEVLTIRDVDAKFGHVVFSGSIIISGNVCEGMHVSAGGCLTVAGLVESARLEVGGDLLVEKGIIGHPLNEQGGYSCTVHCTGAVAARFVQYADISAGGDITIASQSLHSRIQTPGSLTVADASRSKGSLVGGVSVVGQQILAVTIGAVADSSTQLVISGRYPELLAHRKEVRAQIEQSEIAIHQLDDAEAKVHQMPIGDKRQQLSHKIAATRSYLQYNLTSQQQEWETTNAERDAFLAQARILCARHLFPGVKVEIAGLKLVSDREYQTCQIHHQDGALVIEPLTALPPDNSSTHKPG